MYPICKSSVEYPCKRPKSHSTKRQDKLKPEPNKDKRKTKRTKFDITVQTDQTAVIEDKKTEN